MNLFKRLASSEELNVSSRRLLALACLLAAAVVGWVSISVETSAFLWFGKKTVSVSYAPTPLTGIFAILLLGPLYGRGVLAWEGFSIFSILTLVLMINIIATCFSIILGRDLSIGFAKLDTQFWMTMLAFSAIVLSYLGMRVVAAFASLSLFFLAGINLAATDLWGAYGFAFLVLAFLGTILQSGLNPGQLSQLIRDEVGRPTRGALSAQTEVISKNLKKQDR